MSLTFGFPWWHPAVLLSWLIIVVGSLTFSLERHLRDVGLLYPPAGIKFWLGGVGMLVWVWLLLYLHGHPEEALPSKVSVVDIDRGRRLVSVVRCVAYGLQLVTVVGILVIAINHIGRIP